MQNDEIKCNCQIQGCMRLWCGCREMEATGGADMFPNAPFAAWRCKYIPLLSDSSLCHVQRDPPRNTLLLRASLLLSPSPKKYYFFCPPSPFILLSRSVCIRWALRVKIETIIYSSIATSKDWKTVGATKSVNDWLAEWWRRKRKMAVEVMESKSKMVKLLSEQKDDGLASKSRSRWSEEEQESPCGLLVVDHYKTYVKEVFNIKFKETENVFLLRLQRQGCYFHILK